MSEFVILLTVMAAWFTLMRWVLPWLGISTCMSGCCCKRDHSSDRRD